MRLVRTEADDKKKRVLTDGVYRDGTLRLFLPFGGTFDFQRLEADGASDFYPLGRPKVPYIYVPPPAGEDGWPVASLEDVGISREGVTEFIQMIIDTPMSSIHAQEVHGVLIARHRQARSGRVFPR